MPLQFQNMPIAFAQGIDTKVDDKQAMPGKLVELENGIFSKLGAINKRNGYTAISNNIEGGGTLNSAAAIQAYNNELLLYSNNALYSNLNGTGNWIYRGAISSVIYDEDTVIRGNTSQVNPDGAYANGVELYAWEDGNVHYCVIDSATRAVIVADTDVGEGAKPQCIAFNNILYCFYTIDTRIRYIYVNTNNPSVANAIPSTTLVSDSSSSTPVYSVRIRNNMLYLAYHVNGVNHGMNLMYFNTSLAQVGATIYTSITEIITAIDMSVDTKSNLVLVYSNSVNVYKATAYNPSMGIVLTLQTIATDTSSNFITVTGIDDDRAYDADDTLMAYSQVFWSYGSGINSQVRTVLIGIGTSNTISTPATVCRSVGLVSKAFSVGDNNAYVNVCFASSIQGTGFTINQSGNVVGKFDQYTSAGLRTNNTLATVFETITNAFRFASSVQTRMVSQNNTVFAMTGVNSLKVLFNNANQFLASQLANDLHIVGGALSSYDGVSFVEHNFHVFPEGITAVEGAASSGNMGTGTYYYQITYEWFDNFGQIHRSNPSVPIKIVTAHASTSVALTIPTLRITAKKNPRSKVQIGIYRTQVNGTVYQKVSSYTSPTYNDFTADTIVFTDALSDSNLISNEYLYTTGGILNNASPPSCALITTYKNRVFVAGLPEHNLLWYSKPVVSGEPVNFSDALTMKVDARGGDITALAVLNDKLLIYKSNSIFYISGEGPNNAGQNNDYIAAQLITTDVGCTNPNSIVAMPTGVLFQSSKGIYMLNGGMQATYIGAPVEKYNASTVTSATLVPNTNHIRFTLDSGLVLVYDYYFNQWSVFTGLRAVDSDVFNSGYVLASSTGVVLQESTTNFTDAGKSILLKITTGWMSFAGMQGYKRVTGLELLGSYKSTHKLNISVAFDFADAFTENSVIDVDSTLGVTHYGVPNQYGVDSPYGGVSLIEQFKVSFSNQKCESVKIMIQETQPGNYGEGLSISSLSLDVGIKQGQNKLSQGKQFGSS